MGELFGQTVKADDPIFRYTDDDRVILTQEIVCRLSSESNVLFTDPTWGTPIADCLRSGLTLSELSKVGDRARSEAEKSSRVSACKSQATITGVGGSVGIKLSLVVRPVDAPEFPLTIVYREGNAEVIEGFS